MCTRSLNVFWLTERLLESSYPRYYCRLLSLSVQVTAGYWRRPLRGEVRLLKASDVADGEKVASLNYNMGAVKCAAPHTNAVKDELETRLAAAGSRLLGTRSDISGFRNTLDVSGVDIYDIRLNSEDAAAATRTEYANSHRSRTFSVADMISTGDGLREDLRLSKNPVVKLQLEVKNIG